MNSSERRRRRRKTERVVKIAAVLVSLLLTLAVGGGYVYAKYYAESYQRGVAIASGIYFTANYAIEDYTEEDFYESVVSTYYQGSDFSFEFEIRNYENNLLFNESTVEIPYSLSFWLEEEPVGATYTVTYGGETETLTADKPAAATFSAHSIAGGKAIANVYTILVDVEEGETHTPVPVYVEVKTDSGSIINCELRGRMVYGSSQSSVSYIESQGFVVSNENASEEEQFAEIENMSGLIYEVRTVGSIAAGDTTEELKLSWDPAVLEIDLFDQAYLAWKEETGNSAPLTDTSGWYYISIEAMPYASQTISFFRGTDFDTLVNSMETLHSYIIAEKYE